MRYLIVSGLVAGSIGYLIPIAGVAVAVGAVLLRLGRKPKKAFVPMKTKNIHRM